MAAMAVTPSGQTVTSCPMRGNSRLINSCRDFSSSAKSSFNRLCGLVTIGALLLFFCQRQADAELGPFVGSVAVDLDLAVVVGNDSVRDGQAQPDSLAGSPAS